MTLFEVIEKISTVLKDHDNINAIWIEGSWATGKNNEHSDIDVWMDVEDNSFDECIKLFRDALLAVGEIDWEESRGVYSNNPVLQKHTFHIAGFPELHRIELDLQQHSRNFMFDKAQVIRWE